VLSFDLALLFPIFGENLTGQVFGRSLLVSRILFGGLTAFTGFLAHELAHKISAERAGYWAEFRMSPIGLLLSILTAFYGFLFAAPGATVIGGVDDRSHWGRISLSGPGINLVEAAGFVGAAWVMNLLGYASLGALLAIVALVNAIFAAFNLLPFGPLDGRKVWNWSRRVWTSAFAGAVAFALGLFLLEQFRVRPF
jgi:Zn-dependent protease